MSAHPSLRSGVRWLPVAVVGSMLSVACQLRSTPAIPQPAPPPATASAPPPAPAPLALPPPVRSPLAESPDGVPPPPESCFAKAADAGSSAEAQPQGAQPGTGVGAETKAAVACDEDVLESLADALEMEDPASRDAALASLETCRALAAGWTRALRAELGPAECADAVVSPWLSRGADVRSQRRTALALGAEHDSVDLEGQLMAETPQAIESVMVGLAIAARLRRLDDPPPQAPPAATKQQFLAYFDQALKPWVVARAKAVHQLALQASELSGYARGVAAVEAAVADLEFVQAARAIPLPQSMQQDEAVQNAYYAALDEALEPRKRRGRDAALVALSDFAVLGVMVSARIDRARAILAKSYAGHRIDALDRFWLPEVAPLTPQTVHQRLAAKLPTFYAQWVLTDWDVTLAGNLRALLEQGVFPQARAQLDSKALGYDSARLYGRALVAFGQRYWRSRDFALAAVVVAAPPAQGQQLAAENQLLFGLASALKNGPKDAAQMMLGGPLLPQGVGDVTELDRLSQVQSEIGAMAAYNAAHILSFLPPQQDTRAFWSGIARRFALAATLTSRPARKAEARARSEAALETARQVQ